MDHSYKDYVNLLKCFVNGDKPHLSSEPNWENIIQLSRINSTVGIIGFVVMNNPSLVDTQLYTYLRKQCLIEVAMYSGRAERMKKLIKIMNERGIDHLLFKGFVVRNYFTIPELRSYGDIDFVIRKKDRKKSDELMMELGYKRGCEFEPVLSYLKDNEYYEIHTDVMEVDVSDKADYKEYYQHIWEHVVKVSDHTYEFEPEFHFLYLLTHMAKHISSSGAGIRMYLDIAFFIKYFRDRIDWEWIKKELVVLSFTDYANMVLNAVENWFGIQSPIQLRKVDDEILNDYLNFTLEGGTFGHFGRDASTIFLKNQNRNDIDKVSKSATMWHRLFPSADELKYRYSYLQGKKWLLPIAWIHRFFRGAERFEYHVNQVKGIMSTENEKVLKLRRIYKEIGL